MKIRCIWEHNGSDTLLYTADYIGAFSRGANRDIAEAKLRREIRSYLSWKDGIDEEINEIEIEIMQNQPSELNIADADSDVLFETEKEPISVGEYLELKVIAMKSAMDFQRLYDSIPDKDLSRRPARTTFYGAVPRTAKEMYEHTKSVNAYYFGEIGVEADNDGTIAECRMRGFEALEKLAGIDGETLKGHGLLMPNPVISGSQGELWTL